MLHGVEKLQRVVAAVRVDFMTSCYEHDPVEVSARVRRSEHHRAATVEAQPDVVVVELPAEARQREGTRSTGVAPHAMTYTFATMLNTPYFLGHRTALEKLGVALPGESKHLLPRFWQRLVGDTPDLLAKELMTQDAELGARAHGMIYDTHRESLIDQLSRQAEELSNRAYQPGVSSQEWHDLMTERVPLLNQALDLVREPYTTPRTIHPKLQDLYDDMLAAQREAEVFPQHAKDLRNQAQQAVLNARLGTAGVLGAGAVGVGGLGIAQRRSASS